MKQQHVTLDIIVEGSSLAQSTDLNTALIDLFSAYFVLILWQLFRF